MNKGFSLLELTIVLIILSIVFSNVLSLRNRYINKEKYQQTLKKLDIIEKTVESYAASHNRLPCPAIGELRASEKKFGLESINLEDGNFKCRDLILFKQISHGTVPVRTLQLDDDFMFDGWNRRIGYSIDSNFSNPEYYLSSRHGSIKIVGGNNQVKTNHAMMVLISHGKNGYCAWSHYGETQIYNSSTNDDKRINCSNYQTGNYIFIQKPFSKQNPSDELSYFDDIVRYKMRWQFN
ncbi:type II secretion system protein [Candidatus Mesenet endosymbiont of Agriotes lineatus]|uniref:type II secretion system protein n=1 Tax=Candidatus Mesenet endosymbiont of Agriotes lineatus TaxID=3077948 RepID=UPI0030CC290C